MRRKRSDQQGKWLAAILSNNSNRHDRRNNVHVLVNDNCTISLVIIIIITLRITITTILIIIIIFISNRLVPAIHR